MNERKHIISLFESAARREKIKLEINGENIVLQLHEDVFPPMPISQAIAAHLPDLKGLRVADIGTGTGILSIAAARMHAAEVISTDANFEAVNLSRVNFELNEVAHVCRSISANWLPVSAESFDLVLSNPPCMPVPQDASDGCFPELIRLAIDGGPMGDTGIINILKVARKALRPSGRIIFPLPAWCDLTTIFATIGTLRYSLTTIGETCVPFWIPIMYPAAAKWPLAERFIDHLWPVRIIEATTQ